MNTFEEDLEKVAAENIHELLRAWELKHRQLTSEAVLQHTLFRKETRWPGYYYRGDCMKLDDDNWHVLTVSRRDPETGDYTMEKAPCFHLVEEQTRKLVLRHGLLGHPGALSFLRLKIFGRS